MTRPQMNHDPGKSKGSEINVLRAQIKKDWGPKCEDYSMGCYVCQVYRALETIEEAYEVYGRRYHQTVPPIGPVW